MVEVVGTMVGGIRGTMMIMKREERIHIRVLGVVVGMVGEMVAVEEGPMVEEDVAAGARATRTGVREDRTEIVAVEHLTTTTMAEAGDTMMTSMLENVTTIESREGMRVSLEGVVENTLAVIWFETQSRPEFGLRCFNHNHIA